MILVVQRKIYEVLVCFVWMSSDEALVHDES